MKNNILSIMGTVHLNSLNTHIHTITNILTIPDRTSGRSVKLKLITYDDTLKHRPQNWCVLI
uniref:Uncharacterized protein n=1 Tax=Glossina brevipalpis TaxID=37001 RepID=A0A1A9W808_9MUSC